MKKVLVVLLSMVMVACVMAGCSSKDNDETTKPSDSTAISQAEGTTQSEGTTAPEDEEDTTAPEESTEPTSEEEESTEPEEDDCPYAINEKRALEIADSRFGDLELSTIGNVDESDFNEPVCTLQTIPEGDPDPSNQWAALYSKDVWYVEYTVKDNEMQIAYFVIDTDTGSVITSGCMGD